MSPAATKVNNIKTELTMRAGTKVTADLDLVREAWGKEWAKACAQPVTERTD